MKKMRKKSVCGLLSLATPCPSYHLYVYEISLGLCYGVNIDRYYCQQLWLIFLVSNIADFPGIHFCNGAGCMGSETLIP